MCQYNARPGCHVRETAELSYRDSPAYSRRRITFVRGPSRGDRGYGREQGEAEREEKGKRVGRTCMHPKWLSRRCALRVIPFIVRESLDPPPAR